MGGKAVWLQYEITSDQQYIFITQHTPRQKWKSHNIVLYSGAFNLQSRRTEMVAISPNCHILSCHSLYNGPRLLLEIWPPCVFYWTHHTLLQLPGKEHTYDQNVQSENTRPVKLVFLPGRRELYNDESTFCLSKLNIKFRIAWNYLHSTRRNGGHYSLLTTSDYLPAK